MAVNNFNINWKCGFDIIFKDEQLDKLTAQRFVYELGTIIIALFDIFLNLKSI